MQQASSTNLQASGKLQTSNSKIRLAAAALARSGAPRVVWRL